MRNTVTRIHLVSSTHYHTWVVLNLNSFKINVPFPLVSSGSHVTGFYDENIGLTWANWKDGCLWIFETSHYQKMKQTYKVLIHWYTLVYVWMLYWIYTQTSPENFDKPKKKTCIIPNFVLQKSMATYQNHITGCLDSDYHVLIKTQSTRIK